MPGLHPSIVGLRATSWRLWYKMIQRCWWWEDLWAAIALAAIITSVVSVWIFSEPPIDYRRPQEYESSHVAQQQLSQQLLSLSSSTNAGFVLDITTGQTSLRSVALSRHP
ncbi:hypothetical protein DFH29DRAFT_878992 [Suillus ampliporus]|nr:hypothetical protein DFH29DRAFT_878992 [Suillus ampliporus]